MKTSLKTISRILLLLIVAGKAQAQNRIDWGTVLQKNGTVFNMSGKYEDELSHKNIDFDSLPKNTFVYFGFAGCPPCKNELPFFEELSSKYRHTNFIYITPDDPKTIREEFGAIFKKGNKPLQNFYVIRLERSDIEDSDLVWGYPTKYLIDKKKIVLRFDAGGMLDPMPGPISTNLEKMLR